MDSRVKVDHERGIITVSDEPLVISPEMYALLQAEYEHERNGQPPFKPRIDEPPPMNRQQRRAAEARARRRAAK